MADAPAAGGVPAPHPARGPARGPVRGPWHPATHLALLHAAPAFTVIAIGLAFGVVAARGRPDPARLALLAGLLATNQYAAGALNDAVDAADDAAAGRGKPIQAGSISETAVRRLAVASGIASLGFGLALSPATFGLAVTGLACAWSYDLWLKGTPASVLPFAVALPVVPLFGYGAAGRFPGVLWWVWPVGFLGAVAVHLADALPDVESDRSVGARGLVPRLGVRRAAWLAGAAYTGAAAIAAWSGLTAGDRGPVLAGTGVAVALGLAAVVAGRGGPAARRRAYRLVLGGVVALAVGWAAGVRP
jgi:4-hydroxybenzoate polyprenyltransferase